MVSIVVKTADQVDSEFDTLEPAIINGQILNGRLLLYALNGAIIDAGPVGTGSGGGETVPAATETVAGKVMLATNAEVVTGTNTSDAVTPAGVKAALTAFVGGAPGSLDTLDELAAALGDDPNFRTTILNAIAAKQDTLILDYSMIKDSQNNLGVRIANDSINLTVSGISVNPLAVGKSGALLQWLRPAGTFSMIAGTYKNIWSTGDGNIVSWRFYDTSGTEVELTTQLTVSGGAQSILKAKPDVDIEIRAHIGIQLGAVS